MMKTMGKFAHSEKTTKNSFLVGRVKTYAKSDKKKNSRVKLSFISGKVIQFFCFDWNSRAWP